MQQRPSKRAGMAYVAILILLMLASVLALAFSHGVGTQLSILGQRSSALQAEYLAESAANHAIWRMLQEGDQVHVMVAEGADDGEQGFGSTSASLNQTRVALGYKEFVAVRFRGVDIPPGASIVEGRVEFTAGLSKSGSMTISVWAEASDDAGSLVGVDLSLLPRTATSVAWNDTPAWVSGSRYETSDLRLILQELVNRPGWASGNSIVLVFQAPASTANRYATAFEGDPAEAPGLLVQYGSKAPLDPNSYEAHSLADGRYAFRAREHTETTYGTIATVGAHGDAVVQQSYVVRVLPSAEPLHPCLAGWWGLDELSGLTALDSGGKRNDGALVGLSGTEWTDGVVGGGLDMTGLDDRVEFGSDSSLDLSDAMTLSLWVKPVALDGALLLDKGYESSYYFSLEADGSFALGCATLGVGWEVVSNPGAVEVGAWCHLLGTYSTSSGDAVLYKDGVEVMRASGLTAPISQNGQPLVLGAGSPFGGLDLGATVDSVRVYDCALRADEITELFCTESQLLVDAGPDRSIELGTTGISMNGAVSDPCPAADARDFTSGWSVVSGPGAVVFGDDTALNSSVSFSVAGSYVLRLSVEFGGRSTFDDVSFLIDDRPYVESSEIWWLGTSALWQTVDLGTSPYGVPPNAVVEVGLYNQNFGKERECGVRATGSGLNRLVDLHEAEGGGNDFAVMHVQADGSSRIECYAEDSGDVEFVLLGYWTRGAYQEGFEVISLGGAGGWSKLKLKSLGVPAGAVAEILLTNPQQASEQSGGARSLDATSPRFVSLHEAESGGVDSVTMMVQVDNTVDAWVELYTGSSFTLLGYWSTAPGTYTESFSVLGAPGSAGAWLEKDLGALGVPPMAVVQLILENQDPAADVHLGARGRASQRSRSLHLHEAESGGGDFVSLHAKVDTQSKLEWYKQESSSSVGFHLMGWWTF